MTVSPPFQIVETSPANQDIVAQFPALSREFRDTVESWLLFEHGRSGHHAFKRDTTTNRDADSSWEAGSLFQNTTDNVLQMVKSIGPVVWKNVGGEFPAGFRMVAQQTSAPPGWTKEAGAAYDNAALKFFTGAVSNGGTVNFSTVFASQTPAGTIGGTAISIAQMPLHGHPWRSATGPGDTTFTGGFAHDINEARKNVGPFTGTPSDTDGEQIGGEGGGQTHDHTFTGTPIDLAVKFVGCIVIQKDAW